MDKTKDTFMSMAYIHLSAKIPIKPNSHLKGTAHPYPASYSGHRGHCHEFVSGMTDRINVIERDSGRGRTVFKQKACGSRCLTLNGPPPQHQSQCGTLISSPSALLHLVTLSFNGNA